MRASWIFSVNDVLANLGVILSGLIVFVIGSRWPDLIIGAAITVLVLRGGIRIIRDARNE
jgi:Co/Zn/Cd efflux system component